MSFDGMETGALRLPILYGLTDPRGVRGLTPADATELLLSAGVRLIQIRDKSFDVRRRLAGALEAVALVKAAGGTAIINDRCDLALLSEADGVHLGEDDLSADEARRVLGPSALVGISTHSVESAWKAMDGDGLSAAARNSSDLAVSYVALGPIRATGSKSTPFPALGLAAVEQAARRKTRPLVVIGGLTPALVGDCLAAGADSVAMIAGLLDGDPVANVSEARESARRAGFGERF
ncbi:MAG: thiamine phosphate synthase [Thermoanaerobaculia bacterium]